MNPMNPMMNKRSLGLGLLMILAGCAGRAGPGGDNDRMITPLALEPPPIYALLGYRSDLELSSEQVTRLDSIARGVREEMRPLVVELRERSRERSRQPGVLEITPEAEPVLEEIRSAQRRAAEAVGEVLSDEQQESVCRLFDASRGPGSARAAAQQRAPAGNRQRPIGWPWCAPDEEAEQESETSA